MTDLILIAIVAVFSFAAGGIVGYYFRYVQTAYPELITPDAGSDEFPAEYTGTQT
jgi:hypothetical protein